MIRDRLVPLTTPTKNNSIKYYGFDVETVHNSHDITDCKDNIIKAYKNDFYMGSVVGKDLKKAFYDKEEMKNFLLNKRFRNSYIFATNLEFDFNTLFGADHDKFKLIYRAGLKGAIYKDGKNSITFLDTLNYLNMGVQKLGKMLGMPKLDPPNIFQKGNKVFDVLVRKPETNKEKLELLKYNLRDSTISCNAMEQFREFANMMNMKVKYTIGSTGLDYWRRNYQQDPMMHESTYMLKKHFEGSFRGGMTVCYKRGHFPGKAYYYDYNSAYQWTLYNGTDGKGSYPFPGTSIYVKKSTTEHIEDYDGISKARVTIPYQYAPFLGIKINKKLMFPTGNVKEAWFTNIELRKLMDLGGDVYPTEMIYYPKTFVPFRDCVRKLYEYKLKYTKEKHPYKGMVKTLMNSGLFGKFGFNFTDTEEIVDFNNIVFDSEGNGLFENEKITGIIGKGDHPFAVHKTESKPPAYSFPIIASMTTAMTRMRLWEDIRRHHKHLIYTDTDSCVMSKPVMRTGDGLGEWKLEGVIEDSVFIRPKFYKYVENDGTEIFKVKGVPGKYINKDTFNSLVQGNKLTYSRMSKMKESNRRALPYNLMMQTKKQLGVEDDKRLWKKKFSLYDIQDSEPLNMS